MRAAARLRGAGLDTVAISGAGGARRRRSAAGDVDTSAAGECGDERQRAHEVAQVGSHGTSILAAKPSPRDSASLLHRRRGRRRAARRHIGDGRLCRLLAGHIGTAEEHQASRLRLAVGAERTIDRLRTVKASGGEQGDRNGQYKMTRFHRMKAPVGDPDNDAETYRV
jgi:hypothetical protein